MGFLSQSIYPLLLSDGFDFRKSVSILLIDYEVAAA